MSPSRDLVIGVVRASEVVKNLFDPTFRVAEGERSCFGDPANLEHESQRPTPGSLVPNHGRGKESISPVAVLALI